MATIDPVMPSPSEAEQAEETSRKLARHFRDGANVTVRLTVDGDDAEQVDLPPSAVRLLLNLLEEMSSGHAISLIPTHAELTTQQAANLLNVSRPHLITNLLANGELPYRYVGTHRRIRFEELMAYQRSRNERQDKALDALVDQAQELGMGYE